MRTKFSLHTHTHTYIYIYIYNIAIFFARMDVFLFSLDENLLDAFAQRHHHAFSLCFFASLDVKERREE